MHLTKSESQLMRCRREEQDCPKSFNSKQGDTLVNPHYIVICLKSIKYWHYFAVDELYQAKPYTDLQTLEASKRVWQPSEHVVIEAQDTKLFHVAQCRGKRLQPVSIQQQLGQLCEGRHLGWKRLDLIIGKIQHLKPLQIKFLYFCISALKLKLFFSPKNILK